MSFLLSLALFTDLMATRAVVPYYSVRTRLARYASGFMLEREEAEG